MTSATQNHDEIKDRIKNENELINQSMTWLGVFQGLLFGSIAILWDKNEGKFLIFTSCLVGLLVCLSIAVGIGRANKAIEKTSKHWDEIKPENWFGLDSEGYRSGNGHSWILPGSFIPWLFLATWLVILIFETHKTFQWHLPMNDSKQTCAAPQRPVQQSNSRVQRDAKNNFSATPSAHPTLP